MNSASHESAPAEHCSASQTRHHVDFFCNAPQAECVRLVGDFNDWDLAATPMQRRPDGWWTVGLELHHGDHRYLFVVDGVLTLDPRASGVTHDGCTEPVSLVAVS